MLTVRAGFGPSTASLGAFSYKLHQELAEKHNGREGWGYSKSTGTSFAEGDTPANGPRADDWLRNGGSRAEVAGSHEFVGDKEGPAWLTRREGSQVDLISEDETVAQVYVASFSRVQRRIPLRLQTDMFSQRPSPPLQVPPPRSPPQRGPLPPPRPRRPRLPRQRHRHTVRHPRPARFGRRAQDPLYPPPHRSRSLDAQSLRLALPRISHRHTHHFVGRTQLGGQESALDERA